jgi:predicted Zn-dependent protease
MGQYCSIQSTLKRIKVNHRKLTFIGLLIPGIILAQARLSVEQKMLETYGFDKPDPVPITAENPKIAPYFKFYDYQIESEPHSWKVVTLENEYIQVMVLPEIGGKVWGAIEKSTGNEFLYKNEVIKFRNIAMRGPWTSGGIEFNFGIIGHHPSTATPVNFTTRTNPDGSVSCIVGNDDLPSNTYWEVEIRLAPGKAYFETHTSWYNAAPLSQSYYNWMTGAAPATYDLEFFIPGNAYVEHNGNAHTWPIDPKGRDLSYYKNNTFGPSKSYHIVGEYNNFFGGYYHDRQVGFGHWGEYEEIPGQKLWLWDLSRAGGIWEDLLTDTDGQYIEFQAGRLFDQYFPGAVNPISQYGFAPHLMDTWTEFWFPVKEIGGIEAVSEEGVLNVEYEENTALIAFNALQAVNNTLLIDIDGSPATQVKINLPPMGISKTAVPFKTGQKLEIRLKDSELYYSSDPEALILKRPFYPDSELKVSKEQELYQGALEAMEYREFEKADEMLTELVTLDPSHREALNKLAELQYRRGNYEEALNTVNRVLQMDTYNSGANYIAALCYKAIGDSLNALESAGWAARDITFRSVAYDLMAELHLAQNNVNKAIVYARNAVDFNTKNLNALEILLVSYRKLGDAVMFNQTRGRIRELTDLHHFSAIESQLFHQDVFNIKKWDFLTNELPAETILNLALRYWEMNQIPEALSVLQQLPGNTKNKILEAYLLSFDNPERANLILQEVSNSSIELVFPYRKEMLPILEWAHTTNSGWKFTYLLAQNYIAVGQRERGIELLKRLEMIPNMESFYRFRAKVTDKEAYTDRLTDFRKAIELAPNDWKTWEDAIQFTLAQEDNSTALNLSARAFKKFKSNYSVGLAHAKALLRNNKNTETLKVLRNLQVLPYEHASESKTIYNEAHYGLILENLKSGKLEAALELLNSVRLWPENLGIGKPFESDERLEDFAQALIYTKLGQNENSESALKNILDYRDSNGAVLGTNLAFRLMALQQLNRNSELNSELESYRNSENLNKASKLGLTLYEKNGKDSMEDFNTNALKLTRFLMNQSFN